MSVTKKDVINALSRFQICGRKAGSEAVVHAMKELFEREESKAVLLDDAANAFNTVNRQVLLNNIAITCPTIATFVEIVIRHQRVFTPLWGRNIVKRRYDQRRSSGYGNICNGNITVFGYLDTIN